MDSVDIKHFLNWLEIRERHGQDVGCANQLRADADHSALLGRLRRGLEPLPEPPPLAMSYPWYSLIEEGRDEAFEVYLFEHENSILPKGSLVIEQTAWKVLETLGPEVWVATYFVPDVDAIEKLRKTPEWKQGGSIPKKLSDSRWKVYSPGPHPQVPDRKLWMIERV
jgi:hypothetical protein